MKELGTRLSLLAALLICGALAACAQRAALKTNLLHWAALGSPNVAAEVRIAPRWTAELYAGGNLWKYPAPRELRHLAVQPEVRYWLCEAFNGFFVGLHGHAGKFNLGGLDLPIGPLAQLKEHRYEGSFYGAGLSVGHQWILSDRFSLEASLGGGWAHISYRKYDCPECSPLLDERSRDCFGLTRATLSVVYFLH